MDLIKLILFVYLLFMTLLDFFLFRLDKKRAERKQWRIRERTLFLFAWLGGGLGGWYAMHRFRHKTKHWYFRVFIPLSLIPWAVLVYLVIFH